MKELHQTEYKEGRVIKFKKDIPFSSTIKHTFMEQDNYLSFEDWNT